MADSQNRKVPKDWRMVRFGDVVRDVNEAERNPLGVGLERYVGLEHIEPENLHLKAWGDLTTDEVSFTKRFRKGHVLFGKRRAYQRKVAVAEFDGICSSDILTFEPKDDSLVPELLPFIVQSDGFFQHALGTSTGSLSPRTRWSQLRDFELLLPPKAEQRRIAEISWAADRATTAYLHVLNSLDALRHATAKQLFQLPADEMVSLGQLMALEEVDLQTGPFGTVLSASSYVSEGTPIINPVHMNDDTFDMTEGPFVTEQDALRLKNYRMTAGDIVMVRKRHVGRMVYVKQEHESYIVGSDCIRIRIHSNRLNSRYFFLLLQTQDVQRWLVRFTTGTVMPGINEATLKGLQIPILPIVLQQRIVDCLDALIAKSMEVRLHLNALRDAARAVMSKQLPEPLHVPGVDPRQGDIAAAFRVA